MSLTGAGTYSLQALNLELREAGHTRREVRAVHRTLLRAGWTQRAQRGHRLGLPESMRATVREWMAQDLDEISPSSTIGPGSADDRE